MDIPPSLKKNNSEDANKEFNKAVMDEDPTADLTALPTEESTAKPTALPTEKPTEKPTALPTEEPTAPHETEKIVTIILLGLYKYTLYFKQKLKPFSA